VNRFKGGDKDFNHKDKWVNNKNKLGGIKGKNFQDKEKEFLILKVDKNHCWYLVSRIINLIEATICKKQTNYLR
jgi:hypothetical protein